MALLQGASDTAAIDIVVFDWEIRTHPDLISETVAVRNKKPD